MFLLNSRLGLLTAAARLLTLREGSQPAAPLLPKLRGEIAEFLDEGSLAHLGALAPTHQCRFAVRALRCSLPGFSGPPRPIPVALTEVAAPPATFSPRGATSQERTLSSWCAGTAARGHWGFITAERGRNTNRLSIAYALRPRLRPA